ncbi:hypothetical protein [Kitasatospora phosalacinea]|uniref:Uncharacterized protein n=1 Tax=Kitasatospora phosalacinea TaxID=2065 RepID=A0A9W6PGU6_9ACTN|nr:hypothetical protein [Kitasatospora phosalacinea]GLW54622.1 hypothetical protein Kpho01_26330 [Kitasatospora phosalacinea]
MSEELRRREKQVTRAQVAALLAALLVLLGWHLRNASGTLWEAEWGVLAGTYASALLWAAYLAGPGRWFGLRADGWSFGRGAPWLTSRRLHSGWQLRRVPLPVVRPIALGTVPSRGGLLPGLLAYLTLSALGAGLLALVGGEFGRAAAVLCLAGSVGPAVLMVVYRTTPAASAVAPEVQEVTEVLQRDVAGARRLLDALPEGPGTREATLSVLLAEGRYRELADLTAESVESGFPAEALVHARALAYLDETGAATDADRAAFRPAYATGRRLPRELRAGSDLTALQELALGRNGLAIDEARSASAVASPPLRRSMAYATLALALHRAGRPEEARTALAAARRTGPASARLEFLTDLLAEAEPEPAVEPEPEAEPAAEAGTVAASGPASA